MLIAIHTRDVLKYATNSSAPATAATVGTRVAPGDGGFCPPELQLSVVEREQLLTSGQAAAQKVQDPALISAFTKLQQG